MRNLIKIIGATTAIVATMGVVTFPASAEIIDLPQQVTVRPADIKEASDGPGWYRTVNGTASVNATDSKTYNNLGSLEFAVDGGGSYAELGLYGELPTQRLADLGPNGLSYATWQTQDAPQAVSLQVGVDMDVTDSFTAWQGRLVFEPYMGNVDTEGNTIGHDKWQTWIATKSDAVWWMTWSNDATAQYGMPNPCPQGNPCTTAEVVGMFPNVGFNEAYGNPLVLKAGSGWTNFVGYADVPYVGGSTNTHWDFEPAMTAPTTKEACKNEGWMTLSDANGNPFSNQGDCVSSVAASRT